MSGATTCWIGPNPVSEKRPVELFGVSGAGMTALAPVVSDTSPYRSRKINAARQVEPDEGFGSRQPKIEMARVIALNNPGVTCGSLSDSRTKEPALRRRPTRIPVKGIEMHNGKPKAVAEA